METILLDEASEILKVHPQTLLKLVRSGSVPAAKTGKCWVFIKDDLFEYIRSKYTRNIELVSHDLEENECHYTKEQAQDFGGTKSPHQVPVAQYESLLNLNARKKQKSMLTG